MDQQQSVSVCPQHDGQVLCSQPQGLNLKCSASRWAAAVLLLLTLLAPCLSGCGEERSGELDGPEENSSASSFPRSLIPQVGRMHNLILGKTLASLPNLTTPQRGSVSRSELRTAFRGAAREAFHDQPDARLELLLDDAHLDLIEGRFRELKSLLTRAEPPQAEELEALFRSWGVAAADARRAASFARIAVTAEGASESNGPASSSSSSKEAGLRQLGGSSPTLAMIYEVYQASARFWQGLPLQGTFEQEGSFKEEKWEICTTIVMDAEGGLGGLLFGPIGSILASAAYSVLWVATGP